MRKIKVTKTNTTVPCYCCNKSLYGTTVNKSKCRACDGKGNYSEYHYIIVAGNIAFDMDSLK